MVLSFVRFASPVWIGGGQQILEARSALKHMGASEECLGWSIREDGSGIYISKGDISRWVPTGNVAFGIPAREAGEIRVIAKCSRCDPPRDFENLTALRSHERHVHRVK